MTRSTSQTHLGPKLLSLCALLIGTALLTSCTEYSPAPPKPIAPNVISISTPTSTAYMLLGPEKVALINSGGNPEATEIKQALKQYKRSPEQVRVIFTTSPHHELNAGASQFSQAITFTGMDDHRTLMADKHPKALLPKLKARTSPRPESPKSISNVYPGDHLQVQGFKLDVVGAPGVSRDSMMYLFEGILFSGESLLIKNGKLTVAPSYQQASRTKTIKSLSRLAFLKFTTIADAYGQVAAMGPKDVATFLESLR